MRNEDADVVFRQLGRRHELHVRLEVRRDEQTAPDELVIGVECDDGRAPAPEELDALRRQQQGDRLVE